MSSPLFNALGNNTQGNNMITEFQKFRQQMQGKNPQAEINKLLQSGAINQSQLNQVQQMAQQMQSLFKNVQ